MTDQPERKVSALELLLQGQLKPEGGTRTPLRAGMPCPYCGQGRLDYNGLLALECPRCGYTGGQGGGCT